MWILITIFALVAGLTVGLLLGRIKSGKGLAEAEQLRATLNEKENSFERLSAERELSKQQELDRQKDYYEQRLTAQENNHKELLAEKERSYKEIIAETERRHKESIAALKEQFNETSGTLSEQLKNTTEEMLRKRQEEFSLSSGQKIGQILEPLQNSLKTMQELVTENTTRHNELGGKLSESIKNLLDHTESAQASADRLANMLKGSNKHQGEWGERILKEILESLNLKEGIHFDVQKNLTDEKGTLLQNDEGNRMKPDVILHLDQNKDVIIDSKVSLTDYMRYQEAENENERNEALRGHIASLERHVQELARKDYSNSVKSPKIRMGYVIMFVPNTSALLLATNSKPTLWREAMEKNVYIADEQTLYAALKIVSLTWQQIAQTQNHEQVFKLAEEMLKRVATFMKHFTDIGVNLEKASKSYNESLKKLEDGGQSIPKTCRSLIALGAKSPIVPKGVSPELLGEAEE